MKGAGDVSFFFQGGEETPPIAMPGFQKGIDLFDGGRIGRKMPRVNEIMDMK